MANPAHDTIVWADATILSYVTDLSSLGDDKELWRVAKAALSAFAYMPTARRAELAAHLDRTLKPQQQPPQPDATTPG
eukprot:3249800-Rhodomonas_salina.1